VPLSAGYALLPDEINLMFKSLKDDYGYINYTEYINGNGRIQISIKGWKHYEELMETNVNSNKVFVALAFKNKDIYFNAIKPACCKLGYQAILIDQPEHNNDIVDQIIAEIKTSRFVIADLTDNNRGAYFEAGFAQGRGLQVIRTCKKEWFEAKNEQDIRINHLHFDIEHYNFILWDDYEDLIIKLTNRIEACILP
jgi:nucleoside 2-deoxyribosyltransferase